MVSKIMLFFENQFRDNMKGTYTIIKSVPNIISASRGLVSLLLFIFPFGSPLFWLCYLWCGGSDMIDGPLARRMKVASSTGAGIVIAVAMFAAIQEGHLIRTCDSVS